jgi:hypothetical protein
MCLGFQFCKDLLQSDNEIELYEKVLFTSVPLFIPRSVICDRLKLQMMIGDG